MKKYLEYFDGAFDSTVADKMKPENKPYVAYSKTEGVVYTIIPKEEEPDPTAGYVDLGLSVMWASCNLGASNPEEPGLFYSAGNVEGHSINGEGCTTDGYIFDGVSYENSPGYNYTSFVDGPSALGHKRYNRRYDAVYQSSSEKSKLLCDPHIPTNAQWDELIQNTVQTIEVINDIKVIKFTATNNNSIIIPVKYLLILASNKSYAYTDISEAGYYTGSSIQHFRISNNEITTENVEYTIGGQTYGRPIRGVCKYPPMAGSTHLKIGSYDLSNSDQLFYITDRTPLEIVNSQYATCEFFTPTGTNLIYYTHGSNLKLTSTDFDRIFSMSSNNYTNDWVYVKFTCEQPCKINVQSWEISECLDNTQLLSPNVALYISSSTSSNIYRIAYADYQGYDMKIKWNGNARMTTYIGDTCIFSMSTSDSHVIYNKAFSRKGTSTVTADVVNSWESSVDEEGYLYVRFNPGTSSRVTLVVNRE